MIDGLIMKWLDRNPDAIYMALPDGASVNWNGDDLTIHHYRHWHPMYWYIRFVLLFLWRDHK